MANITFSFIRFHLLRYKHLHCCLKLTVRPLVAEFAVVLFSYIIKDEIGLHARPAGLLAKEAKKYQSTVTLSCKGKSAAASKLMAIMGMGVKHGDNVEVTIEGADEDTAAAELQKFFRENL